MKFLVVLAAAVACAAGAAVVPYVSTGDASAPIVKSDFQSSPEGNNFEYSFETGNGIYAHAEGVVKNPTTNEAALQVQGLYKYVSPDGTVVETQYISDENGFRPTGSHIPVAPAIPELIQRSLAYIAAHPPPVEKSPNYKPY